MLRKAAAAGLKLLILALAVYAFFFLPLGRRTPYQHLNAIFSSQPAREAAEDLTVAGQQIKNKVREMK
ncbi:MAG TPA: hypothetical protein PLJ27_16605 [Polyangiaceae bacterium]|jgi:hypothetical protein|nr:MAG: hypothetical protein BWY17_00801 [Deltaproteobacteria bacterium ADurb.Bin207]HNS96748.1 hypothetical protein [Polyangiaceae bacterium]HNZ20679.1 hypothetical protein [Polyangiaceae bacterium]HOD20705.1 hypothetical protein [Polyangiaceae bacterium]HOE47125.1 hypothetical protein [Polyangiaceae bacterium]